MPASSPDEPTRFRIDRRGGCFSLIDPAGRAVFLIGVNHIDSRDTAESVVACLTGRGFNCAGHDPPAEMRARLPYLASVPLVRCQHYLPVDRFAYDDVFDPAFARDVGESVAHVCDAHRGQPNLVGYYLTDTPQWDIDRARRTRDDDWVSAHRRLSADRPGKRAYLAFLSERYPDRRALCEAYGLDAAGFDPASADAFASLVLERPEVRTDDERFLGIIADRLFRLAGDALAEHDPGALRFGDRFKMHDLPGVVLDAAARHADVIAIQPGPEAGPLPGPGRDESRFDQAYFASIHRRSNRPIFICDHTISFHTEDYPVTLWHQMPDQTEAGRAIAAYVSDAASCPFNLGYVRCQYRSHYIADRGLLKQGLLDVDGRVYEELADHVSRANGAAIAHRRAMWSDHRGP